MYPLSAAAAVASLPFLPLHSLVLLYQSTLLLDWEAARSNSPYQQVFDSNSIRRSFILSSFCPFFAVDLIFAGRVNGQTQGPTQPYVNYRGHSRPTLDDDTHEYNTAQCCCGCCCRVEQITRGRHWPNKATTTSRSEEEHLKQDKDGQTKKPSRPALYCTTERVWRLTRCPTANRGRILPVSGHKAGGVEKPAANKTRTRQEGY